MLFHFRKTPDTRIEDEWTEIALDRETEEARDGEAEAGIVPGRWNDYRLED